MSRRRFAALALLYALIVAYASTVVGPVGIHYVPLDPAVALHRFLATPYVHNGSDQRADWMGNLTMLVPFGFLVAGSLWPRIRWLRPLAALVAFAVCLALVLAVKYAQLFFPPRTVTLNYILAQAAGSAIGIAVFAVLHSRLAALGRARSGTTLDHLATVLQIYTAAVLVFLLMPLDFALNATDLQTQMARLPDVVGAVTGEGRPTLVRLVLIAAGTAALVPIGMLLTITRPRHAVVGRSVAAATLRGFLLMAATFALSTLLISGAPSLLSLAYRTFGIALGAWCMHRLTRLDLTRLRRGLAFAALWLAVPYVALLLAVNGLLSTHWLSFDQAVGMAYPLGLLPLFDYYIVTKAEAAKNIVAHLAMYAPVGVMAWSVGRAGSGPLLAMALAFGVELGRYFRPGLEGDINAVVLAGLSAWCAGRLMPLLWGMLANIAPKPTALPASGAPGWRERAAAARARTAAVADAQANSEIEHY